MQRLAMTDELTGIHNRRQIQAKGRKWFTQAREEGKPLCVLLLDVDHFKKVNDQLGHHVGDSVLTAVAQCIEEKLRSLDRVGRNGGEEFLVLLPDTLLNEAVEVAERIQALGWSIVVYFEAPDLEELILFLESLPTVIVVDHMGRPDVSKPLDGPEFSLFLRFMREHENVTTGFILGGRVFSCILAV